MAQTPSDDCASTYYRDKSEACLSATLAALRDATSVKPEINAAMVGFLAGVIKSTPTMEAKILAAVGPPAMKTTILMALDRAGRDEAARSFAQTENLQAALAGLESELPPRLDEVKPRSAAADNDLLIGAFMATGDPAYIKAILGNFSAARGRPDPRRRPRRPDASALRRARSARRLPAVGARRLRQVSVQARSFGVLARHDALLRLLGARLARRQG